MTLLFKSLLCACLSLGCCALLSATDAASELNDTLAMAKELGMSAEQINGLKQFDELQNAGKYEEAQAFAKDNDVYTALLKSRTDKIEAKTKHLTPAEMKKLAEAFLVSVKKEGLDDVLLAGLTKYVDISMIQGDIGRAQPYEHFMTEYQVRLEKRVAKEEKEQAVRSAAIDAMFKEMKQKTKSEDDMEKESAGEQKK